MNSDCFIEDSQHLEDLDFLPDVNGDYMNELSVDDVTIDNNSFNFVNQNGFPNNENQQMNDIKADWIPQLSVTDLQQILSSESSAVRQNIVNTTTVNSGPQVIQLAPQPAQSNNSGHGATQISSNTDNASHIQIKASPQQLQALLCGQFNNQQASTPQLVELVAAVNNQTNQYQQKTATPHLVELVSSNNQNVSTIKSEPEFDSASQTINAADLLRTIESMKQSIAQLQVEKGIVPNNNFQARCVVQPVQQQPASIVQLLTKKPTTQNMQQQQQAPGYVPAMKSTQFKPESIIANNPTISAPSKPPVETLTSLRSGSDSDVEGYRLSNGYPLGGCLPRKSSHNVIEKRYRMSINERIVELKNMLLGEETKMNKSGVLRKAVEQLQYLQSSNSKLREENIRLTMTIANLRQQLQKAQSAHDMDAEQEFSPSSGVSLLSTSPLSSHDEGSPFMTNKVPSLGKMTMCMGIFFMLTFNSYYFSFPLTNKFVRFNDGRKLNSVPSPTDGWYQSGVFWIFNVVMLFVLFSKLFFTKERGINSKDRAFFDHWRSYLQAKDSNKRGYYSNGIVHLQLCLRAASHRESTSGVYAFFGIIYYSIRCLFQYLFYKHRAFGSLFGLFLNSDSPKASSLRNITHVYHQLHQMQRTGVLGESKLSGLYYALRAASLSIYIEPIEQQDTVEIFLCLFHTLKNYLPHPFNSIFSKCAYRVAKKFRESRPNGLDWAFSKYGSDFMFSKQSSKPLTESRFSKCSNHHLLMSVLEQHFREYLLMHGFKSTTLSDARSFTIDSAIEAMSCFKEFNDTNKNSIVSNGDEYSKWWSDVILLLASWSKLEYEIAQKLVQRVRQLPASLNDDSLSLAVLLAIEARNNLLEEENAPTSVVECVLNDCDRASELLSENIQLHSAASSQLEMLAQLTCCDILLITRKEVWESVCLKYKLKISSEDHEAFVADFNNLRMVSSFLPIAKDKVYVFDAVNRTMAGANSIKTQSILCNKLRHACNKSSVTRNGGLTTGEEAKAALVACQYLPRNALTEELLSRLSDAAELLECIGDKYFFLQCQQVLKHQVFSF